jgi:hypothetical protein
LAIINRLGFSVNSTTDEILAVILLKGKTGRRYLYDLREHASDINRLLRKLVSVKTGGGTAMPGSSYGTVVLCRRGESIPVFIAHHCAIHK